MTKMLSNYFNAVTSLSVSTAIIILLFCELYGRGAWPHWGLPMSPQLNVSTTYIQNVVCFSNMFPLCVCLTHISPSRVIHTPNAIATLTVCLIPAWTINLGQVVFIKTQIILCFLHYQKNSYHGRHIATVPPKQNKMQKQTSRKYTALSFTGLFRCTLM